MKVNGEEIPAREGDSVLVALLRAGRWPETGGTLCLAGDCPHCLAAIDGIAYRRMCQVRAEEATEVVPHGPRPPLPALESRGPRAPHEPRHLHCDVVVIGRGRAGQAAAREARAEGGEVVVLDAGDGQEVIGIYPGPLVVAKTRRELWHVHPRRHLVAATGSVETLAVAPGSDLQGLLTRRAASQLHAAGVKLGQVAALGRAPFGLRVKAVQGTVSAFEARPDAPRKVGALVFETLEGHAERLVCDTAVIDLGANRRVVLGRLAERAVVPTKRLSRPAPSLPPAPREGIVCPCLGASVADLESVTSRGFTDLELVKRAALVGTGPCQGAACMPHVSAVLADLGIAASPHFTPRPVARPVTIGEAAAGATLPPTPRTALDGEHRRLGARMDRIGGWWRPWTYGDGQAEYRAVRHAVSICDVGTLGKMRVAGPDALRLLEFLYPTKVASLAPGRSRYALLLNERGYVLDDGMIARESDTRFRLTFTTGGATHAELWLRDWAESMDADVRILNQTWSHGAINVTGPHAPTLLTRLGATDLPAFLDHRAITVATVQCHVMRLSFTGEASFELHHDAADSVALWRALLEAGADLGIRPHGLETLLRLRLEKGHLLIGQDTDFDSTPRRLGMEWAARLDKAAFVGRQALVRTNRVPLDRRLVGLEMAGEPPAEGALIWAGSDYAGYVTSSGWSPTLEKSVLLGWVALVEGQLPDALTIAGRPARPVPTPFYDPEGQRARA